MESMSREFLLRSPVEYSVLLDVHEEERFEGVVNCKFKLVTVEDLHLDFTGIEVHSVLLNGKPLDHASSKVVEDGKIWLSKSLLIANKDNDVKVKFGSEYGEFERGLLRAYISPENSYVYSSGGPGVTRTIFPLFDQPELRGHFTVGVVVSNAWVGECLSEKSQKQKLTDKALAPFSDFEKSFLQGLSNKDLSILRFSRTTLALPPHCFALCVGIFGLKQLDTVPAVNLFSHKETKLPPDSIFKQAIDQLNAFCSKNLSSVQYPFASLNLFIISAPQVYYVCPPNLILSLPVNVSLVYKGFFKAFTLWCEYWADEGISDMLSDQMASNFKLDTGGFKLPSHSLTVTSDRIWALKVDSIKELSRPVYLEEQKKVNPELCQRFVGIKSSASLKSLEVALGPERFPRLINEYLKKSKWTATHMEDFIEICLDLHRDIDSKSRRTSIERWKEDWMTSAGINNLRIEWEGDHAVVVQDIVAEDQERFRLHFISFAFLNSRAEVMGTKSFSIKPISKTKLNYELFSKASALIPNHNGHTFARITLDPKSLEFLSLHLNKIPFKVSQLMVYESLYAMVLQGNISPKRFCDVILDNFSQTLPFEYQQRVIFEFFWPVYLRCLSQEDFAQISDRSFDTCFEMLRQNTLVGSFKSLLTKTCFGKQNILKLFEQLDSMDRDEDEQAFLELYNSAILRAAECSQLEENFTTKKYESHMKWAKRINEKADARLNDCLEFDSESPEAKRRLIFDCLTVEEKGYLLEDYVMVLQSCPELASNQDIDELCLWYQKVLPKNFDLVYKYLQKELVPRSESPEKIQTCLDGLLKVVEFSSEESRASYLELLGEVRRSVELLRVFGSHRSPPSILSENDKMLESEL